MRDAFMFFGAITAMFAFVGFLGWLSIHLQEGCIKRGGTIHESLLSPACSEPESGHRLPSR